MQEGRAGRVSAIIGEGRSAWMMHRVGVEVASRPRSMQYYSVVPGVDGSSDTHLVYELQQRGQRQSAGSPAQLVAAQHVQQRNHQSGDKGGAAARRQCGSQSLGGVLLGQMRRGCLKACQFECWELGERVQRCMAQPVQIWAPHREQAGSSHRTITHLRVCQSI